MSYPPYIPFTQATVTLSQYQIAHINKELRNSPININPLTISTITVDNRDFIFDALFASNVNAASGTSRQDAVTANFDDSAFSTASTSLAIMAQLSFHKTIIAVNKRVAQWAKVVSKDLVLANNAQATALEHSARFDTVISTARLIGVAIPDDDLELIVAHMEANRMSGMIDWIAAGMNDFVNSVIEEETDLVDNTVVTATIQPQPVIHVFDGVVPNSTNVR